MQSNLWDHTLKVLENLPDGVDFPLAMAALLHGLAMPFPIDSDVDLVSGDPRISGRIQAERIARGLKLSNAERTEVGWLVETHGDLVDPERLRIAPLKKLLSMPGIEDLLTLHRAIAAATGRDIAHVEYCERYLPSSRTVPSIRPRC